MLMPDISTSGPIKKLKLRAKRGNSKDTSTALLMNNYVSSQADTSMLSNSHLDNGRSPQKQKKLKIKLQLGARKILSKH